MICKNKECLEYCDEISKLYDSDNTMNYNFKYLKYKNRMFEELKKNLLMLIH
jgi:hypothetical protein